MLNRLFLSSYSRVHVCMLMTLHMLLSKRLLDQILVDYFYDPDIQSIYFKQKTTDNKVDFIIPITVNENINLLRLNQIRTKLCDNNESQGIVAAVVCANGAVIYHRFSDGKVLDFRLKIEHSK